MRKTVLLLTSVVAALLMASGVALAVTVRCEGGKCRGTHKDDSIVGTDRRDVVEALGGADEVIGREGNDALYLQGGADQARERQGNDEIWGGDGDDNYPGLRGGDGNDLISSS